MNYLAHLFLAGENTEFIVGNFIADHVKGNKIKDFSPKIQEGIKMHRHIDAFTDQDTVVHQSILRLRPIFHKYSGVITDMYYDHFLSSKWTNYSGIAIEEFSDSRMKQIELLHDQLPERAQRILYFMKKQNWLVSYSNLEGLHTAFTNMANRTKFQSNMQLAVEHLQQNYDDYHNEFNLFFPRLIRFVETNYGTI